MICYNSIALLLFVNLNDYIKYMAKYKTKISKYLAY